jgi:PAS domain S-box-containing protein
VGLLQSLIHGASDALFIAEVDTGVIVFVNDAACRMMEATREELIGLH